MNRESNMTNNIHWQRLDRKTVYSSKFLKVYEDRVQLGDGKVIDHYTVVEKPSIVMVVATDVDNKLIILSEYKYAANDTFLTLPAGHKKHDESPIDTAKRELLEETGYGDGTFEEAAILRDYPTKDLHKVYVVRATGLSRVSNNDHEETEIITHDLVSVEKLQQQIKNQKWQSSSAIAALSVSGILF